MKKNILAPIAVGSSLEQRSHDYFNAFMQECVNERRKAIEMLEGGSFENLVPNRRAKRLIRKAQSAIRFYQGEMT